MTERLIEASIELFDDSEVYYKENKDAKVMYANGDFKIISSNHTSGVMMRVKKGSRLGTASATTPDNPKGILEEAGESAKHGETIPYSFSLATDFPKVDPYSKDTADYPTERMIELCSKAKDEVLKLFPDIAVNVTVEKEENLIRIATASGTRAEHKDTGLTFVLSAPIKGAGLPIYRYKVEIAPFEYPQDVVSEFTKFYAWTRESKTPKTGRMPVIWAPQAMDMFALALCAGMSGEEFYKKTSPLMEKFDKKILSEKLTLWDDPHTLRPGARAFDDEGIPTEKRELLKQGVLKGVLLDLRTASKLGARSTGNGFKRALFAGSYNMMPNPWPANLCLEPGESSLDEMIASLDEGILLMGGMGFHSGNYSQGQIAVQAVGYMIEKGKVTGRLDSTMLSTNIYEDFLNVRSLSKEVEPVNMGYFPYILVDSMQVVGK